MSIRGGVKILDFLLPLDIFEKIVAFGSTWLHIGGVHIARSVCVAAVQNQELEIVVDTL